MSEKNRTDMGAKKTKSSFKKQKTAVIILAITAVLLGIGLFAVSQVVSNLPRDFVDPNDGTLYHIKKSDGEFALFYTDGRMCPKTEDGFYRTKYGTIVSINKVTGEYLIDQNREMIFDQLFYDVYDAKGNTSYPDEKIIERLDVENIYGSYAFVRDELDAFILEGHPDVTYTQEAFAYLMMACSYPLSYLKLESPKTLPDGSTDLAEYGLSPEQREEIVVGEDGEETTVTYDYFPAKATLTVKSGEEFVLYFGDQTIAQDVYYVKYEGKDDIFVLQSTGITDYITQKIESVISPSLVHDMTSTDYVHVKDFILFDHGTNEKLCHFTYQDLEERQNSIYASLPFISHLDYSKGYYINSTSITQMLQNLYETNFIGTEKLSPSEAELDKYGLLSPATTISYTYFYTDEKGEIVNVDNKFVISAQNLDGSYYAYSETYDMIVCVDESSFDFLKWEKMDWYDPNFMQFDIGYLNDLTIEAGGENIHFSMDNSQTLDGSFFPIVEDSFEDDGKNEYQIKLDGGKYSILANKKPLSSVYSSDYLILGIPYVKGTPETNDYLFAENVQMDADGDGENDSDVYFFYNIMPRDGKFVLYATMIGYDLAGNQITSPQNIYDEATYSTDYLITTGYIDYLFLLPRDSKAGKSLSKTYYSEGEGWVAGEIYTTADGQYMLVDPNTGEWSMLESVSNQILVADKGLSKLDAGGVNVSANGKNEVYYTLTGKALSYNEETGRFELYDKASGTRTNANYNDVFPGVWAKGDFHVSLTGDILILDPESGDAGVMYFASSTKYNASVYANGRELDYIFSTTDTLGNTENHLALYNFQQFYTAVLFGSFEGECGLSEQEMEELRKLDDFSGADERCMMKMTLSVRDMKGNELHLVYRFYRISERRAYVTIEALDSADAAQSSESAYGGFYVLSSYVEKLASDAGKVLAGTPVSPNSKY